MRKKSAPFVFTEAGNGKSDHLRTASGNSCRTCDRKTLGRALCRGATRHDQRTADRGAGDRKRERHTDNDGNDDTHNERCLCHCPADESTDSACGGIEYGSDQHGKACTDENGNEGSYDDINLGLLGNEHTDLSGNDGDHKDRKRSALTTKCICGIADSRA